MIHAVYNINDNVEQQILGEIENLIRGCALTNYRFIVILNFTDN